MKILIKFLSTGFFIGYFPLIPGTLGTFASAFIYWQLLPKNNILFLLITLVMVAVSVPVCTKAEVVFGKKDEKRIIIDEIAGFWVSMLLLPRSSGVLFAGIVLFRLFDIYKPFFIKKVQVWNGGLGVVADDVFAGLFTNIILWVFVAVKNI
ncbi:MAG: phosphatidylglycerophosphatase A [Elusimicrobia bacterium]|nr:phosphatidylglycerophosphatase A [Candidatus Liberimonas magnetica]